jgi:hypothetical protein
MVRLIQGPGPVHQAQASPPVVITRLQASTFGRALKLLMSPRIAGLAALHPAEQFCINFENITQQQDVK